MLAGSPSNTVLQITYPTALHHIQVAISHIYVCMHTSYVICLQYVHNDVIYIPAPPAERTQHVPYKALAPLNIHHQHRSDVKAAHRALNKLRLRTTAVLRSKRAICKNNTRIGQVTIYCRSSRSYPAAMGCCARSVHHRANPGNTCWTMRTIPLPPWNQQKLDHTDRNISTLKGLYHRVGIISI